MGRFPGSGPGCEKGVPWLPGGAEAGRDLHGRCAGHSPVQGSVRASRTGGSVRRGRGLQEGSPARSPPPHGADVH